MTKSKQIAPDDADEVINGVDEEDEEEPEVAEEEETEDAATPAAETEVEEEKPKPAPARRAPGQKEVPAFQWKLLGEAHGAVLTLFKAVEREEVEAQLERVRTEGYYQNLRIVEANHVVKQAESAKTAGVARPLEEEPPPARAGRKTAAKAKKTKAARPKAAARTAKAAPKAKSHAKSPKKAAKKKTTKKKAARKTVDRKAPKRKRKK